MIFELVDSTKGVRYARINRKKNYIVTVGSDNIVGCISECSCIGIKIASKCIKKKQFLPGKNPALFLPAQPDTE